MRDRGAPKTRWLVLSMVTCGALHTGCGAYSKVAAHGAAAEMAAVDQLRSSGRLAYRLCRASALYSYFDDRLMIALEPELADPLAKETAGAGFYAWYEAAIAGDNEKNEPVAWARWCQEFDQSGVQYNAGLTSVREYAQAVSAIATSKEFNASGLGDTASGIAASAKSLSASSDIVSVTKTIGGALPQVVTKIADLARERKLKTNLTVSAPIAADMVKNLRAYVLALEGARLVAENKRVQVAKMVARDFADNKQLSLDGELALAADTALNGDHLFDELKQQLAAQVALLEKAEQVLKALATAGQGKPQRQVAEQRARELAAAVEALAQQRAKGE